MCGIVGYIGPKNIETQLIKYLKLLEYRGYDSAGIATLKNNKIILTKKTGNISKLEKFIKETNTSNIGIAHTRWATHGKPTIQNAHPHTSCDKSWAIVHNGIIENFNILKTKLLENNYIFKSETDTEVIANLLQENACSNNIETVIKTCNMLRGSFALAMINKNNQNTLYLAKRKSPLFLAKTNNEIIVASDPVCFTSKVTDYYDLDDNEFCEVNLNKITFYNKNGNIINKKTMQTQKFETSSNKLNYNHYMLKEIEETPNVLLNIANIYEKEDLFSCLKKIEFNRINKIILLGCGTAHHAGLMAKSYIEKIAQIDTHAYISSEFRYSCPLIDSNTLVICVSQSGETADTLMAHELAKSKKATTIALTNVLYSSLAKKCDYVLPTCAGVEISVASTKAYTAQITILNMLAKYIINVKNKANTNYINEVRDMSKLITFDNTKQLKSLSNKLKNQKNIFFIGKHLDYITCKEACLKLKEITYINSQAYPAGELKHGFLALVDNDSYVFVIATNKDLLEKTINGAHEAQSRGAKIILVSQFDISKNLLSDIYQFIKLPSTNYDLMPVLSIIPFQLLSYYTSINKGINPDQPRNLAKSVTVE